MKLKARDVKYLDEAIKIAIANPTSNLSKMAAIIVENKRIVGVGLNRKRTSPLQFHYAKNPSAIYEHAEIAAIKNAIKFKCNMDFTNASLYVGRVLRDGSPAMACPCDGCARAIKNFGFKSVYWTNDN